MISIVIIFVYLFFGACGIDLSTEGDVKGEGAGDYTINPAGILKDKPLSENDIKTIELAIGDNQQITDEFYYTFYLDLNKAECVPEHTSLNSYKEELEIGLKDYALESYNMNVIISLGQIKLRDTDSNAYKGSISKDFNFIAGGIYKTIDVNYTKIITYTKYMGTISEILDIMSGEKYSTFIFTPKNSNYSIVCNRIMTFEGY